MERFISECVVCLKAKAENKPYPVLLEPLPVPNMAWTHISMDFVEWLPKSKGKDVILVVVDRMTKYSHFIALSHPYTVTQVVELFINHIYKLHGMPSIIVFDRDIIFTIKLWQELFRSVQVQVRLSIAYHSQTDGQTKRVNQCLEVYLRWMAFQEPKHWMAWLAWAEWWYNSCYHTSLKTTPFQALYGLPPPQINEMAIPGSMTPQVQGELLEKGTILGRLR